jgi:hypothetical protein
LSNILTFLPIKDLKETLQVSHLWNYESKKCILQRGRVQLMASFYYQEQEQNNFFETVKCFQNFRISQSRFDYWEDDPVIFTTFEKKVIEFCSKHTSIQHLNLFLQLNGNTNTKFIAAVLKTVPQIKDLRIILEDKISKESLINDLSDIDHLWKLKKLELSLYQNETYGLEPNNIPGLKKLFRKILQITPNIEELTFLYCKGRFSNMADAEKIYIEELKVSQLEWRATKSLEPMPFRNLYNLGVHLGQVEILLELLQPIRILTISTSNKCTKGTFLHKLLEKHADTLESFRLIYKLVGLKQVLVMPVQTSDFPNLLKLQSLQFYLVSYHHGLCFLFFIKS